MGNRKPQLRTAGANLLFALTLVGGASCTRATPYVATTPAAATWSAFAVRFATLPQFRVRGLVVGADSSRRLDVPVMVIVLRRGDGSLALIDAGFYRQKFLDQWKPRDYQRPPDALRSAGFDPARVTDIIVTHVHWDHADAADLFPNARVWLQKEEFEYHVGPEGQALQPAIDKDVAAMFRQMANAGRVRLIDGDDQEALPGVRVYTGGKHTFASQYAAVQLAAGMLVVASDNAYLYENIEKRVPITQTLDTASNVRAQGRMLELAGSLARIIPGHDPAVFTRFERVSEGVARLR